MSPHKLGFLAAQTLLTLSTQSINASMTDDAIPANAIRLQVIATDVSHRILRVSEQIPVGNRDEVTLYFPKWIPGTHAPSGPIDDVSGLIISSEGSPLHWRRDTVDMNAFHVSMPKGANQLDVRFQTLCSEASPSAITSQLAEIEWNTVSLYPKDIPVSQIPVAASLQLPPGWKYGTALTVIGESGAFVNFKTTSYEKLVDSPVLAGANFRQVELEAHGGPLVRLNIAADRKSDLDIQPFQIDAMKRLVGQADQLFKSHHYDHYDFLLSISDELKFRGLEHHESSEDGIESGFFENWDKDGSIDNQLMPHEYVHSWNGKYRRPLDLTTQNFATPMQNSLLWVYEGLTEYWGYVLAARSGLQSIPNAKDDLAFRVASVNQKKGREWRDLQDTTNTEILTDGRRRPIKWPTWQRGMDYYSEGSLMWLEADTIIRQSSNGRRSLDDFASTFFGRNDGEKEITLTYDFEALIKALNDIQPFDWREYFSKRLTSHDIFASTSLAAGGYNVKFTEKKSEFLDKAWKASDEEDFYFSLGLVIDKDGKLVQVVWDSPAFASGLSPETTLVAVNGEAYKAKGLSEAITAARNGGPIELLVKTQDKYRAVSLNYRDGLRFPHLEKIAESPLLDKIFSPK